MYRIRLFLFFDEDDVGWLVVKREERGIEKVGEKRTFQGLCAILNELSDVFAF